MTLSPVWTLTARHGDELDADDHTALQVIRRTLLGMLGHGFITELNTFSGSDTTVWSYRSGTEDGGQIMVGLLDTVGVIAPDSWEIEHAP